MTVIMAIIWFFVQNNIPASAMTRRNTYVCTDRSNADRHSLLQNGKENRWEKCVGVRLSASPQNLFSHRKNNEVVEVKLTLFCVCSVYNWPDVKWSHLVLLMFVKHPNCVRIGLVLKCIHICGLRCEIGWFIATVSSGTACLFLHRA